MEGTKALFLIESINIENGKTLYQAVEVETQQPVILKKGISMNTKLEEGKTYWCMVNQNYINLAEPFEEIKLSKKEEKVAQKEETKVSNPNVYYDRDLMILYQNQTMPAIEILSKQQHYLFTDGEVILLRDKLVQDILTRCRK